MTLEQKEFFIRKAEENQQPLSEWVSMTLTQHQDLLDVSVEAFEDQLQTKGKLIDRLTIQIENAEAYIQNLEKSNYNYKLRNARLLSRVAELKLTNADKTYIQNKSVIPKTYTPYYVVSSLAVLVGVFIFGRQ